MTVPTPWQIDHGCGRLQWWSGSADVILDRPASGLTRVHFGREMFDATRLLGIEVAGYPDPLPGRWIVDSYIRRQDLIVSYERPEPHHLRTQVYWRHVWEQASGEGEVVGRAEGVQLIVSLQTNRLDLQPSATVISDLPAGELLYAEGPCEQFAPLASAAELQGEGEAWQGDAPLVLARPRDVEASIVLMILPSDLVATRLPRGVQHHRVEFQMLNEHLEKGVIRRAQAAVWWVPRRADEQWAFKLFGQLRSAPPPLTT